MLSLESRTHWLAAQAQAQTKAWKRVCLPQLTTKTTNKQADENEARLPNTDLAKWRVNYFYDSLVQGSTLGILMYIYAENLPLRKAENRPPSPFPQYTPIPISQFLLTGFKIGNLMPIQLQFLEKVKL